MNGTMDHKNGTMDHEDMEDIDDLSYDHGNESDFSDEQGHGHMVHNDLDSEGHDEGHHEIEAASGARSGTEQPARSNARTKTSVSMKDDDIVFETFYHRSGKEFQCIYQSGMRFYLDDWGSKEWQPFPKRWYNEGLLVTNTILKDENAENNARNEQAAGASGQGQSSRSQGRGQGQSGGGGGGDDREGFLMHPTKGRIPTYIFYKKHNVHMYFDRDTGSWVRMPVGWELHHNMVKSLVDQVDEAVPTWGDRHDILALLRACNYDPDECISIYLHLERDEWMKGPKTSKENKVLMEKEVRILELEKRVRHLEIQLQKEMDARADAERNLEIQMTKFSELEAESKETEAHLSAVTGGRPPTARPFSRMVKPGQKGAKGVVAGAAVKGGGKQVQSGEVVNPDDVLDLNANAKELRKAHTRVKMDMERFVGDMKHMLEKIGPAFKQMKQSEKGTKNEIEEVRALYRKEALQRRLLYNQLQELRGNIRVFCRVRKDDRAENCLKFPSDQDVIATSQGQKKMFNFDRVFDPSSTQEAVFEDTKPIITSCADGYNVCLLAYGQTGSGKTFTMMGPDSNPGINIRAMKELFQVCSERKETMSFTLTVSLVEIYNETIQDLLTNDAKTLELRTAGNKVQIPGLTEHEIKNVDDVKRIMAMGDKNRSVASTKMNSTSSRSHLVLMLAVEGHDKVTSAITRGTLVLCDLAGSERISKTEAEGQRLVEAAAINKSLSALGQVFSALRSSQLHVPYRNSKLTQILQPSLGGDAKACLFVNVSPDNYNFSETVSTLTFGSNARQVALGQAKQNISKGK
ncbi:kinesin-like protein klp-3 isoform X2 [Ruditapes philippinarum]|uniref:kinesin-like protein klp-3 isoform X2 n=1 Tax=Ruditapes philippinarum TaxID=129788 RepID=UPI00295A8BAA|nr:kinesin-like protein klp-3 isoform X2 [Ruditapes philippinarum]XP_060587225.1 kinesin-like protein klp-3 isoform X2 [Ruditapes philippinarum]